MIKNIVFDLGNVLLTFVPSDFLDSMHYPGEIKAMILADVFKSREWQMLDSGDIDTPGAIETISKASSLRREEIARIFNLRREMLTPIETNVKLLPELKKQGFRLYFLSNFPADIWEDVRDTHSFFNYFDGGLISALEKVAKPDKRIYKILFERYDLLPGECLYIDDLEPNVRAAEETGMTGIFTHGSSDITELIRIALPGTFRW
jgi:putative hydrolase of the HAD superfamily